MLTWQNRSMSIVNRGPTLTQQTTERLRQAIVDGELPPGSLHSATALGEWLGVSRTPVREATAELARLGLVSIEPNRGIRILETDIDSLIDGFELRMIVEVPLARKAALSSDAAARKTLDDRFTQFRTAAETDDPEATLRADRDFHSAVLEMAGNARAAEVLQEQRNVVVVDVQLSRLRPSVVFHNILDLLPVPCSYDLVHCSARLARDSSRIPHF